MGVKQIKHREISLRLFFTLPIVILFIFIATLISLVSYYNNQLAAQQFGQKMALQIAKRTNDHLDLLVSAPKSVLDNSVRAFQDAMFDVQSETDISRYLLTQIRQSPYLTFVSVGFANGQYIAINRNHLTGELSLISSMNQPDLLRVRYNIMSNGLPGDVIENMDVFDARRRPWFEQAIQQQRASWYPVYSYAASEGLGVGLSAPVYSMDNQLQAVLAVDLSLSLLSQYLQSLQMDMNATVFVIGPQGNLVAASLPASGIAVDDVNKLTLATQSINPLIRLAAQHIETSNIPAQHRLILNKQHYLLNVTEHLDSKGLNFKTLVIIPENELLSFLDKYLKNAVLLMVLAIVFGGLLTMALSRRLITPIYALNRSAELLASGNKQHLQMPKTRIKELSELISAFEEMANQLNVAFTRLENKVEQSSMNLQQLSLDVHERQQRTERQRSALAMLVVDETAAVGDSMVFAKNLSRITADAVLCERVSVWLLSESGEEMQCIALHQTAGNSDQVDLKLKEVDYPQYFSVIATQGWLCADDALNHYATREFAENYLKPLGIGAILDGGIIIAGKVVGVVCLEHVGGYRKWHADEEAFVGAVAAVFAQVISLNQQKIAESISKENAEHTQTILNNVIDGIVTMDAEGTIISMNPAAQRLLLCKEQDYLGLDAKVLLPTTPEDEPLTKHYFPAVGFQPALGVLNELDGLRRDGSFVSIELALSAIKRQNATIYIATLRDISERKRLERLKNEFISTVSHELRTPLTSISGAISIIKSGRLGVLSEKLAFLTNVAHNNCQSLMMLVNDLLDFEKIAAGKMQFDLQPKRVVPLLQQALDANKVMADEKQIHLTVQHQGSDCKIRVDGHRFIQVISNFLSNAIKFSPDNSTILLTVSEYGDNVRIAVCDQGPGIPKQFIEKVFQRFSQADASDTRKVGGTGLGLAISKELVQGMHGEIGFESIEGQGATFYCIFKKEA